MQKIYNFFLKRYIDRDYPEFSHAKLILHFCLVTALFSLFYVAIASIIQFRVSVLVMTTLAILFSGLGLLLRSPLHHHVVSFLYLLASFAAAFILIIYSGMMYSSIVPWLAFIPLSANLLTGRRAAFFWLAITSVSVFVLIFFTPSRESIEIQYDAKYDVYFFAFVYNGLTAIVLTLSVVFQRSNEKYVAQLKEKNDLISGFNKELKMKNEEISVQNAELIQQKEEILTQRSFIATKNKELLTIQDELNDIIEKLTNTQNSLAQREAENGSILDAIYNTHLLVGELDREGRFMKMSATTRKFLNIKSDKYLGKSFREMRQKINLTFDQNTGFVEFWQSVLSGQHSNHEVFLEIEGKKHWLKVNFFPILNEEGTPVKVMIVAQDITQLIDQKNKIEVLNLELTQKISEIERKNSLLIAQRREIEEINEEIKKSNEEIRDINSSLEERVRERTKILEEKNKQLAEYAYINAHLLRGPLCSILGLVNLLENNADNDLGLVVYHMKKSTIELHDVVKKITKAIGDGIHFDRNHLSDN